MAEGTEGALFSDVAQGRKGTEDGRCGRPKALSPLLPTAGPSPCQRTGRRLDSSALGRDHQVGLFPPSFSPPSELAAVHGLCQVKK